MVEQDRHLHTVEAAMIVRFRFAKLHPSWNAAIEIAELGSLL
jgi:hypothetical protein